MTQEQLGEIAGLSDRAANFDREARIDADEDGWETEVFSEAVTAQLKQLCKLLGDPGPSIPTEKLLPFVTEQVTCGPLRPKSLEIVFRDPVFEIRRPAADLMSYPSGKGVEHFAREMNFLAQSLRGDRELHTKTKVIRVVLTPTEATTFVHFSASRERVGQNADWECTWSLGTASRPPLLSSIRLTRFEETQHTGPQEALFSDVTASVFAGQSDSQRQQLSLGVDYWRARRDKRLKIDTSGAHGLAVGDVNGDGLEDIYLCQTGGIPNRLLLQQADGTVRDFAVEAGVDFLDATRAVLLVDLDNDGDEDLVLSMGSEIFVLSNSPGDNGPTFVREVTLKNDSQIFSLSCVDFDRDGDLDIFACGYFENVASRETPSILGRPIPYHDANNGGRNTLWQNELSVIDGPKGDDWEFVDVTDECGLGQNNHRFSFAASWEDYDNDGDLDLYVANDFGRNHLYRNTEGQFTDVAAIAGVEDISSGMSVSWGDYNNDGWMDLYVANMFSSAGNRIAYQRQFQEDASQEQLSQFRRYARGNSLFENSGDGTFRDVSESAAVSMGRWAWSSLFLDVNNDGNEDLLVGNGFITTNDTGDL